MSMPEPKPGVSAKVANGGVAGALALGITFALTTAIPGFHTGIPPVWKPLIDGAAGLVAYYVAAYRSTHRATMPEIQAALEQARQILATEAEATAHAAVVANAAAVALPAARPPTPG